MATYLIGDVHGCISELHALLRKIHFSLAEDRLWLTGDLVARGPHSLAVLRFVRSLGESVRMVLGNHDLHFLAVHAGLRQVHPADQLAALLSAEDIDELVTWLRYQPLLQIDHEKKLIMSHAGISPQWNIETAIQCANEIETVLKRNDYVDFLKNMYGDRPNYWSTTLTGAERLRFIANVFTRMRFCTMEGCLDLHCKLDPVHAPFTLKPWFALPSLLDKDYSLAFGHWAALRGKGVPKGVYALDTGCCWGGALTALRWEDKQYFTEPAHR